MTKTIGGIIIGLLAAILLVLTNPNPQAHRSAIEAKFTQRRPLAGAVGLGALDAHLPDYHSLVLASYTSSGDKTRSIGALGVVWVLEDEPER